MIAIQAQNLVPFGNSISSKGWQRFAYTFFTYASVFSFFPIFEVMIGEEDFTQPSGAT